MQESTLAVLWNPSKGICAAETDAGKQLNQKLRQGFPKEEIRDKLWMQTHMPVTSSKQPSAKNRLSCILPSIKLSMGHITIIHHYSKFRASACMKELRTEAM